MAKKLEDTGERMVPEYHKGTLMYGEHIARYKAAASLTKDKTVLDIACGSGYGTSMLAAEAKKVIGVDLHKEAINYANKKYKTANTEFLVGDAVNIPLSEASVDAVVSFETIEHIDDYKKFVSEVKRVVKPGGVFLVSTPNDKEFPEGADFHVHEFKQAELVKLLKTYFKNVEVYYQSTWLFNAILNKSNLSQDSETDLVNINVAPVQPDESIYFLMVCSDSSGAQTVPPIGVISERWTTKNMLEHNAKMDKYIRDTIKHFEKIIEAKDKEAHELRRKIDLLRRPWRSITKRGK